MSNPFIRAISQIRICPTVLMAVTLVASIPARAQGPKITIGADGSTTISVHTGRPLAEVLEAIQKKYVIPITFEEAPFASLGDLQVRLIKQTDGSMFRSTELPVVDFSVKLLSGFTAPEAVETAIAAYVSRGFPGVYKTAQETDRIRVFPKQVQALDGTIRDVSPVMDSAVTFPLADRGTVTTFDLITSLVSKAAGANVQSLNLPFNLDATIVLGADKEPARDIVKRIGEMYGLPASFQCLYDPTEKTYYLNVEGVYAPVPPGGPPLHGYIRPLPKSGPANSPWFTKTTKQ